MSLSLTWTRYRRPTPIPDAGMRAVLRFSSSDRLAVDVDAENGGHLRALLHEQGRRGFDWFETTGGFLVGIDLATVTAVDWLPPAAIMPAASPLDSDHLVLRFRDGHDLRLTQIAADDIDRLRGATICSHGSRIFRLGECRGLPAMAIPVTTLVLATLPVHWMDAEPN